MPICYLTVGWLAKKDISVKNKDAVLAFVRDDIFCERNAGAVVAGPKEV